MAKGDAWRFGAKGILIRVDRAVVRKIRERQGELMAARKERVSVSDALRDLLGLPSRGAEAALQQFIGEDR